MSQWDWLEKVDVKSGQARWGIIGTSWWVQDKIQAEEDMEKRFNLTARYRECVPHALLTTMV